MFMVIPKAHMWNASPSLPLSKIRPIVLLSVQNQLYYQSLDLISNIPETHIHKTIIL